MDPEFSNNNGFLETVSSQHIHKFKLYETTKQIKTNEMIDVKIIYIYQIILMKSKKEFNIGIVTIGKSPRLDIESELKN